MGEDSRTADAGSGRPARFRTGGTPEGRTAGSEKPAGPLSSQFRRHYLTQATLEAWGRRVGAETELPLVLALRGPLGAGKSVLARAVARGAGIASALPSPTFNLLFHYQTARAEIFHLDLYRLDSADQVWELGWSELASGRQIVLIEWPERAEALLPPDRWDITLAWEAQNPDLRELSAMCLGAAPALPELE